METYSTNLWQNLALTSLSFNQLPSAGGVLDETKQWKIKIHLMEYLSYLLETSGGKNCNQYLSIVYFNNTTEN
jgi:hypothetical protein